MKKMCLVILGLTMIMRVTLAQGYSGGAGTEGSPYQIGSAADLIYLSQHSDDWDKYFVQTGNIAFNSDETLNDWDGDGNADGNGTAGWTPIGNAATRFTGSYDGDGHTISNLFINRSDTEYIGFFGYTFQADIANLGMTDVDFVGKNYVGGLVGYTSENTVVSNSYATGSVSGVYALGGLVGQNANISTIVRCFSAADVTGSGNYVGGLAGYNMQSTISNSYATGSVTTPSSNVGGFVGYAYLSTIQYCYSSGKVYESSGTIWNSGTKGFIGDIFSGAGTISNNFFDSEASEQATGHGATAKTTAEMKDHSTFINNGWDFTDIWTLENAIDGFNKYPNLKWANTSTRATEPDKIGEIYQISSLDDLRWIVENDVHWDKQYKQTADIDASSTSTWDGGAGWTAMGTVAVKFTGSYDGDGHTISNLFINRVEGDDQGLFGYIYNSSITNLALNNVDITARYRVGGLAARPDNSTIENCSSSGTLHSIGTTSSLAGGLVGATYIAVIRNSYSSVNVTAEMPRAGGLVGQIWGTADSKTLIERCYATGNVQGSSHIGGFIGFSDYGTIQNCYASGDVTRLTGSDGTGLGAFLGQENYSPGRTTIDKCYAIGSVYYADAENPIDKGFAGRAISNASTMYTNNFFDSDVSNQTTATGAEAKTTVEMTNASTTDNIYLLAGWDFKGESDNGTDEIWNIGNGRNDGYPYFNWQYPLDDASLPVILASFTGKHVKGTVVLEWETSAEIENQGFVISRQEIGAGLKPILETRPEIIASFTTDNALKGQGSTTEATKYSYVDKTVEPGKTYEYTLTDVDYASTETILKKVEVEVKAEGTIVAECYVLDPVYPNPFNAVLTVPFTLSEPMKVSIDLYSLTGRHVSTVVSHDFAAGSYAFSINADDLSSGIYFVRTTFNNLPQIQKVMLIK